METGLLGETLRRLNRTLTITEGGRWDEEVWDEEGTTMGVLIVVEDMGVRGGDTGATTTGVALVPLGEALARELTLDTSA
jgi:hypothetical protein